MNIPITEILSYQAMSDTINPEDALRCLAEMYVDNCGVSRGMRGFADYCADYWIKKLKERGSKILDGEDDNAGLCHLLPKLTEKYTEGLEDKYDSCCMDEIELRENLIFELKNTDDEKIKIILCAGIMPCLEYAVDKRWLRNCDSEEIERGIINLGDKTLIKHRAAEIMQKYSPFDDSNRKIYRAAKEFSDEEIAHFVALDKCLALLQHKVMEQVEAISQDLKNQIDAGLLFYENFCIEGYIYIDIEYSHTEDEPFGDKRDSLIEALVSNCPKYSVCYSTDKMSTDTLKKLHSDNVHWYANWGGIFHQLEEKHGIRLCRAFRAFFEDIETFTISDIMKFKPAWFHSQIKISINE